MHWMEISLLVFNTIATALFPPNFKLYFSFLSVSPTVISLFLLCASLTQLIFLRSLLHSSHSKPFAAVWTSLQLLLLNEGKDGFCWRGGIWSLTEWGEPSRLLFISGPMPS